MEIKHSHSSQRDLLALSGNKELKNDVTLHVNGLTAAQVLSKRGRVGSRKGETFKEIIADLTTFFKKINFVEGKANGSPHVKRFAYTR